MAPVAAEIETDRVEGMNQAILGALSTVLSKKNSNAFEKIVKSARSEVEKSYRINRGLDLTEGNTPADQMMNIVGKLGIPIRKTKPRKAK
jgi:hypothetical protein